MLNPKQRDTSKTRTCGQDARNCFIFPAPFFDSEATPVVLPRKAFPYGFGDLAAVLFLEPALFYRRLAGPDQILRRTLETLEIGECVNGFAS